MRRLFRGREPGRGRDGTVARLPASVALAVALSVAPGVEVAGQGVGEGFESPAAYAHEVAPSVRATRIEGRITIDGVLDEPAWMAAPAITDFTQTAPEEGSPVSQPTEVRILYDDDYLYVGGWMWDDGEVWTRLARRDVGIQDADVFAVHLDGYHDHRTAYRVATSPSGWIRDESIVGVRGGRGGSSDASWDPIWETRSTTTEEGWFVEIAIPFSQLRYRSDDLQTWGLQIERKIRRRGEDTVWAFVPRNQAQGVARYGHLEGLEGLRQGKRLEVLPYSTARAEYREIPRSSDADFENPFRSGHDYFGNVGADLKYRLGANFTLDATANPDFGQVEQDPAVINLTAFETRFDEKRPFFVEGADIFSFGDRRRRSEAQLLYSRRIGRAPQGSLPDEAEYADVPSATTILGAAKVTGRTASGWSLGILDGVGDRATAPWVDASGTRERTVMEPRTNYLAARLRRDLDEGTRAFGVIGTAVNRALGGAPELAAEMHRSAYAAGADGHLEWSDRSWALDTRIAGSRVSGTATAIAGTQSSSARYFDRPDADHLDFDPAATALSGFYGSTRLQKQSGTWQGGLTLTATSPGFEVNDLGFQTAADRFDVGGEFGYRQPTTGRHFRDFSVTARGRTSTTFGREALMKEFGLTVNARHMSQNGFQLRMTRNLRAWNDRLTRGGPLAVEPGRWAAAVQGNSDSRKPVQARVEVEYGQDDVGGWSRQGNARFAFRIQDSYELVLGATLIKSRSEAQYVQAVVDPAASATYGSRYVFASIDQQTLEFETRVNLTFTPELSFELYAQPFIASGDYLALKELAAPRTFDFLEYGKDAGTIERAADGTYSVDPVGDGTAPFSVPDRDFNFLSLLGNAVLRWEWRPGSTVFLVWQQSRAHRLTPGVGDPEGRYGRFAFGPDTRELFRIKPDNVFMVKATYWLNP